MWKKVIWSTAVSLLFFAALFLIGCREEQPEIRESGAYQVYYLDSSGTKLVSDQYQTDTEDTDLLVEELMTQLRQVPQEQDIQSALPERLEYRGFRREEMVVYLYFDDSYNSIKSER